MENKQLSMKWYNAYKIIMLVMGILSAFNAFGIVVYSLLCLVSGAMNDASVQAMSSAMLSVSVQMGILQIISMAVFFLSYYAIKKYKSWTVTLMYVQNVWFPLAFILFIPIMITYMSKLMAFASMDVESFEDLQRVVMVNDIVKAVIIIIGIFIAVAVGGALVPNTIYFRKRKHMLGQGEPAVYNSNMNYNQNMYGYSAPNTPPYSGYDNTDTQSTSGENDGGAEK